MKPVSELDSAIYMVTAMKQRRWQNESDLIIGDAAKWSSCRQTKSMVVETPYYDKR